MERLQAELARILLRLSVWMAKAAQHLWVGFQKLSRTLHKLAARIPLTAFQWLCGRRLAVHLFDTSF